jgi:hypothetical protein
LKTTSCLAENDIMVFFNGINVGSDDLPVGMYVQSAAFVLSHVTYAELGIGYLAVVMTKVAVYFVVTNSAVQHGFLFHQSSRSEDDVAFGRNLLGVFSTENKLQTRSFECVDIPLKRIPAETVNMSQATSVNNSFPRSMAFLVQKIKQFASRRSVKVPPQCQMETITTSASGNPEVSSHDDTSNWHDPYKAATLLGFRETQSFLHRHVSSPQISTLAVP